MTFHRYTIAVDDVPVQHGPLDTRVGAPMAFSVARALSAAEIYRAASPGAQIVVTVESWPVCASFVRVPNADRCGSCATYESEHEQAG